MKIITLLLLTTLSLFAELFSQGGKNFGVSISAGSGYGSTYTIVGVSANYFVIDNLLAGLEYRGWYGGEPSINEVSLPVTYIAPIKGKFRPYVGGFVRHTFMGSKRGFDYEDYNVYGGRAGVSIVTSGNSYATLGWVQEYYDNDQDGSSYGYMEMAVGVSF